MHIDVPYRGKRTYLHSTNLFDHLVSTTGVDHNISLTFRRKIEHQVEAVPTSALTTDYPARFTGEMPDGSKVDLALIERQPLAPLSGREPYDEDAIARTGIIDGQSIGSAAPEGASAVERIVALNKRLIMHIIEAQRVLLFSKVSLKSIPAKGAVIRIELKSRLGMKLFRSAILADRLDVGEIVFFGT